MSLQFSQQCPNSVNSELKGNGTFAISVEFWIGHESRPCTINVGDFTNDGKPPDITVANEGTDNLKLFFCLLFCLSRTTSSNFILRSKLLFIIS